MPRHIRGFQKFASEGCPGEENTPRHDGDTLDMYIYWILHRVTSLDLQYLVGTLHGRGILIGSVRAVVAIIPRNPTSCLWVGCHSLVPTYQGLRRFIGRDCPQRTCQRQQTRQESTREGSQSPEVCTLPCLGCLMAYLLEVSSFCMARATSGKFLAINLES